MQLLMVCFVLAADPGYLAVQGADGQAPIKGIALDANAKATRYQSAGCSEGYQDVKPTWGCFLGEPHQQVQALAAAGPLPISPPVPAAAGGCSSSGRAGARSGGGRGGGGSAAAAAAAAAASNAAAVLQDDDELELQGEEEHHCHPRMHCARESSKYSNISDECGLVGGVCSHGQPLVGCFLAMPAPERSLYYDVLVSELCKAVAVDVMYLDIGCIYKRHWDLYMGDALKPAHIKVPWWHATTHGASCFLQNSGMYHSGVPLL
jgi:hypothetical protein